MSLPAESDQVTPSKARRDGILEAAGELRTQIYQIVRSILDDLEEVAPWSLLYCPPEDPDQLLALERALLLLIDTIPQRLAQLSNSGQPDEVELHQDIEFFFSGIHMSVQGDLDKLSVGLDRYKDSVTRSPQDADLTCEIAADLKGKYSSSLMGAAANLISGGDWSSIEIEPLLFPEKVEEFKRNRALVASLSEVIDSISRFTETIDLHGLLETWQHGQRADRYALSSLYTFLGMLGRLLQEGTRRALYSGDFHQIQQREQMLSTRINELNLLHSSTWDRSRAFQRANSARLQTYASMAQKLLELIAILDIELLRKITGDKTVKDLRLIVTLEKEEEKRLDPKATDLERTVAAQRQRDHPRLRNLPKLHHTLVPLLYDEDLNTFLELLLGSVLKRASLTLPEDHYASLDDSEPRSPEPTSGPESEPAVPSEPQPVIPATGSVDEARRIASLVELKGTLSELSSRSSPRRKSFNMVHRLLRQGRSLPPAMVQSMQPFLDDLAQELAPRLVEVNRWFFEIPSTIVTDLEDYRRVLSDSTLQSKLDSRIPEAMDAVESLLAGLAMTTDELLLRIEPSTFETDSFG